MCFGFCHVSAVGAKSKLNFLGFSLEESFLRLRSIIMRFTTPLVLGLALMSGCTIKSADPDESAGGVPARDGGAGESTRAGEAGSSATGAAGESAKGGSAGTSAGTSNAGESAKAGNAGTSAVTSDAGESTKGGSTGRPVTGNAGLAAAGSVNLSGTAGELSAAGSAGEAGSSESMTLLDIASDELAAGATEVTLDTDTMLKLTFEDDKLVLWEVTISGQRAMVVDYGDESTQVAIDENMDGYIEYLRTLTGSSEDDLVTIQETTKENAAATRATITRTTSVDDLHIVEEVQADDGSWSVSEEGDITKRQAYDATITVDGGSGACTPDQQQRLQEAARRAITEGAACLKARGLSGLAASLQALAAMNGFNVVCRSMSELAYADTSDWESNQLSDGTHYGSARIEFNPTCVSAAGTPAPCASNASTEGLLFHEMLHFLQGAHSLWFLLGATPERAEKDFIYSCQFACFDTNLLTKCSCAVCSANYTPCSRECSSEKACLNEEDGYCHFNCPCNSTDYETVSECNANCDVSLACFTGICRAVP